MPADKMPSDHLRGDPLSAPVILASGSEARARLLRDVGIKFSVAPAGVDEAMVKESLQGEGASASDAAAALAELKANRGSQRDPTALVIGADQILECDGVWYDKPENRQTAKNQLRDLAGKTHRLWTTAAVAKGGSMIWHHNVCASLTMRMFSPEFLDAYVERLGDNILKTVGGYELEGEGLQLFEKVEGDYFGILGLPMLELISFLREHQVIEI